MKFKKVEIQAFRAYDKVEDGTFDFTGINGESADFISIYAPNGFGKTSFYDAVEWAYTNNINRFLRKHKENQDASKAERNKLAEAGLRVKHYIIRNKFSDLEGYVRLHTSKGTFKKEIPPVRSGQPDYKFDEKETNQKHAYLRDVILSQEYIDAFLKEENAEERYSKFMEYFGDKELDSKYKLLITLLNKNDSRIEQLTKELKKFQLELRHDLDSKILDSINEAIVNLNKKGEKIQKVDLTFSDKELLELSNFISSRIIEIDSNLDRLNHKGLSLNEKGSEVAKYFNNKKELKLVDENLKLLHTQLTAKWKRSEAQTRIDKISNEIKSLRQKREELFEIESLLEEYYRIRKALESKQTAINTSKIKEFNSQKQISQLSILISELESKQESINKELIERDALTREFPILLERRNAIDKLIIRKKEIISEANAKVDLLTKENDLRRKEARNLQNKIKEIHDGRIVLAEYKKNLSVVTIVEAILQKQEALKQRLTELEETNHSIAVQESLSKDLKDLLASGTLLISKGKLSTCPLCTHNYDSFEALSEKILANPAIDQSLQRLIARKAELESITNGIVGEIADRKRKLTDVLQSELQKLHETIGKSEFEIEEIREILRANNTDILNLEKENDRLKLKTAGLSVDEYNIKANEVNLKLKTQFDSIQKELQDLVKLKQSNIEENDISQKNIAQLQKEFSDLAAGTEYLKVMKFLVSNGIQKDEQNALSSLKKVVETSIEKQLAAVEKDNQEIISNDSILASVNIEAIEVENENGKKIADNLAKSIAQYELSIKQLTGEEISEKLESEIKILIEDKFRKAHIEIVSLKKLKEDFQKLLALKENVLPFLKQEKLKHTIRETELKIKFQKDTVGKALAEERLELSKFIDAQVESFFFEDLINRLYQKIDPHPEYKQISFKCDFSFDKPRLNVFVSAQNEDSAIIPNLYFSTAQLNILSLSIFLAKALNTKDENGDAVECIFVDDPIQSMDSINILSTVDLLRSIVVNFNKQIILSTHDENFHLLLQKKIPSNIFNSTFLELETFGKVKSNIPYPTQNGNPKKNKNG